MDRVLLRPSAAAEALSLGRSQIYELIKRGHVATVVIGTRSYVTREEVERIAKEGIPVRLLDERRRPAAAR